MFTSVGPGLITSGAVANFKENLTERLRSQRYEVHAGFMKIDSWIEETALINVSHREDAKKLTLY